MHQTLAFTLLRRKVIQRGTILQVRPVNPDAADDVLVVAGVRRIDGRLMFIGQPGHCQQADAERIIGIDGMPILRVARSVALDEMGNHAPQRSY